MPHFLSLTSFFYISTSPTGCPVQATGVTVCVTFTVDTSERSSRLSVDIYTIQQAEQPDYRLASLLLVAWTHHRCQC
eukprot:1140087-Pelagomonas_calceolata.AAC.2